MGLKTISEQFREDLLRVNLQTPPDVVVGLTDLGGSLSYSAYKDSLGQDAAIHRLAVNDPGNVLDIAKEIRKYLFKRNLQTPSDIEHAIIDLSANQSETMRNMGSIGTDANINWRAVVVDAGTVDNAAMVTREANLSRNKPRDLTDPSESNTNVIGDGYNYTSLLQTIGMPALINNFTIPNVQSVGAPDNPISVAAQKLDLKINRYIPDEYLPATIRENILNEVYKRTTYVADYTNSLKNFSPQDYQYFGFYNLNSQATVDTLASGGTPILAEDTMLMNIGAYMLNYNLQARFEQNLYSETVGKLNLINRNYNSQFPVSIDPLELIRIAKDPLDNLIEKNYTITVPRNFVGKAAQFLLGLEGVVSPFQLWESVDLGGKDRKPSFLATDDGLDALNALDPSGNNSAVTSDANTAKKNAKDDTKDDEALLKKSGGGQRWSLYENLSMNKYSPKYDTRAEMIQFKKKNPKGLYYIGSQESPPIDILQARPGVSIINNNVLSSTFNKGYNDNDGYTETDCDVVWVNNSGDKEGMEGDEIYSKLVRRPQTYSTEMKWRPSSLMDITQKILYIGGIDSPIRNLKTKFCDGKMVYSKGNATKKIQVIRAGGDNKRNIYNVLEPKVQPEITDLENVFCRTWTKAKPYGQIINLVRYGELIRRERNSVIDRNANYNIYPTKLNVGTLYDQQMLGQDGVRGRFADKNFDKIRARKYMFSIENLAWKDSDKFNELPAYEQGSNGGRVMWFPPYGLTFNESSAASWTTHTFLGRPEPIYTYNNTERTGTLSWMVIVDHPTILNVLVQKELFGMSDADVDNILNAFFAGCVQYDIFELARIWGMFSNADISFFKDVIDGKYPYPVNITNEKKTDYNYKISTELTNVPHAPDDEKLKTDLSKLQFFFPNDVPRPDDTRLYGDIYTEYLGWMSTGHHSPNGSKVYDYRNTIGNDNVDGAKYFVTPSEGKETLDIAGKYSDITKSVKLIQDYCAKYPSNFVTIGFDAYASTIAPSELYNQELAKRRAVSVAKWYAKELGFESLDPTEDNTSFKITLVRDDQSIAVEFKADFSATSDGKTSASSRVRGRTITEMFSDIGWTFGDAPIIYEDENGRAQFITDYTERQFTSTDYKDRYEAILSYPVSYARRVQLNVKTELQDTTTTKETVTPVATENPQVLEYNTTKIERFNVINKRDIATRILNKLIGENEYFEFLKEDSPVIFDSLKDKLKYFSPAFHSMTPEGLNSRLTFLQQCVRPGDTIQNTQAGGNEIVNTAFGKPPVCVLRIGDFYNTRMIIDNINIEYNVVGNSVTYDLNPEGIGVQPMLAKVTMSVKYVGGAGLREPVAQLQNALSYNYYANADMYESKSFGQTDANERYLENLELAYNSDVLDIVDLNLVSLDSINPDTKSDFEQLGVIDDPSKYPSISFNDPLFNPAHKIKEGLDIVQYYEVDYSQLFSDLYAYFNLYVKNYFISLTKLVKANPFDFFALTYGALATVPATSPAIKTTPISFGYKKDDAYFNHKDTPVMNFTGGTTSDPINLVQTNNYFAIGYDSFNKSNSIALTTKLHVYPQMTGSTSDRIVNPIDYKLQDFVGIMVPKYIDTDYLHPTLAYYRDAYLKYLKCDEWILFGANSGLKNDLELMNPLSKMSYHDFIEGVFNEYFTDMFNSKFATVDGQRGNFVELHKKVLATNAICNGIDGGISSNGASIRYLEVVPNQNSESSPNLTKFFDFTVDDCLNKYPTTLRYPQPYKDVAALPNDLYRGLFNYLQHQTSNDYNQKWMTEGKPYFDFTTGEWKVSGSPIAGVKCRSTFEKLNFERLYFGHLSQQLILDDVVSETLKNFRAQTLTKTFDSTYTDERKNWVKTCGVPVVNNSKYDYLALAFDTYVVNDTITNAITALNAAGVKLEDVIFYGFLKDFLDNSLLQLETELVAATDLATDPAAELKIVQRFMKSLKSASSGIKDIDNNIKKITTGLQSSFEATSSNMTDVVNPIIAGIDTFKNGGYKLKMFEVSESRANSFGRGAMKEYLTFKNKNK